MTLSLVIIHWNFSNQNGLRGTRIPLRLLLRPAPAWPFFASRLGNNTPGGEWLRQQTPSKRAAAHFCAAFTAAAAAWAVRLSLAAAVFLVEKYSAALACAVSFKLMRTLTYWRNSNHDGACHHSDGTARDYGTTAHTLGSSWPSSSSKSSSLSSPRRSFFTRRFADAWRLLRFPRSRLLPFTFLGLPASSPSSSASPAPARVRPCTGTCTSGCHRGAALAVLLVAGVAGVAVAVAVGTCRVTQAQEEAVAGKVKPADHGRDGITTLALAVNEALQVCPVHAGV